MKKIIIFSLILFSLITFNKISYAEYDHHTLQSYNTILAQNSSSDELPELPQTVSTNNKDQIDNYLKQDESLMNTNMLFKALKALGLAFVSFILFVVVILLINKFLFKKNQLIQEEEIEDNTYNEVQNDELNKIQDNYQKEKVLKTEDIIYDFYKRNID